MATLYQRRLLHDLAEMSTSPYENIIFHPHENDINKACLVLTPPGLRKIHLTVDFGSRYPLVAPKISIQTRFKHPNVFDDYICASILNTDEGYTPAYTLKGIAIQILSFFSSDTIQQDYGTVIDLAAYRGKSVDRSTESFHCSKCGFPNIAATPTASAPTLEAQTNTDNKLKLAKSSEKAGIAKMPAEILLRICDCLESEQLIPFMRAWDKIGGAEGVVTKHGLIRLREVQCFALKEGFGKANLGVGVHVVLGKRYGTLESEFDLLSDKAFHNFGIRKSVQGLRFERWLPLAISRPHYQRIKTKLYPALEELGTDARLSSVLPVSLCCSKIQFSNFLTSVF